MKPRGDGEEAGVSAEAFTDFYRRHYRTILTVAQQRLTSQADAEDATAEVFRIAWRHDAEGQTLSLPWVYQVLRNVIGNEYRRTARAAAFVDDAGSLLTGSARAADRDDALTVRRAMSALPREDRELLYMTYWEDLTGREVAGILGCSAVTVRVRLLRARRRLKAVLDAPASDPAPDPAPEEVPDGRP